MVVMLVPDTAGAATQRLGDSGHVIPSARAWLCAAAVVIVCAESEIENLGATTFLESSERHIRHRNSGPIPGLV